jgi:hypothetical protein
LGFGIEKQRIRFFLGKGWSLLGKGYCLAKKSSILGKEIVWRKKGSFLGKEGSILGIYFLN